LCPEKHAGAMRQVFAVVGVLVRTAGATNQWSSGFTAGFDVPPCTLDQDCNDPDVFGPGSVCVDGKCAFLRTCAQYTCPDTHEPMPDQDPSSLWCTDECTEDVCCLATTTTTTTTTTTGADDGSTTDPDDTTTDSAGTTGGGTDSTTTTTTLPSTRFTVPIVLTMTGTPPAGTMEDWARTSQATIARVVAIFAGISDSTEVRVLVEPGTIANTSMVSITFVTRFEAEADDIQSSFGTAASNSALSAALIAELQEQNIPVPEQLVVGTAAGEISADTPGAADDEEDIGVGGLIAIGLAALFVVISSVLCVKHQCDKRRRTLRSLTANLEEPADTQANRNVAIPVTGATTQANSSGTQADRNAIETSAASPTSKYRQGNEELTES